MTYEPENASSKNRSTGDKDHITTARGDIVGGDIVRGDQIVVGDITGSYVAIGRGAQVIVQRALSAAEEAEKRHELESRILAQAVVDYVEELRAQIPPSGQLEENVEPYKSLLPYRLADAPLFFGRNQATAEMLTSVGSKGRGRLTVLHSESGAGKTSLLQAGLAANLLAEEHMPLYVRAWRKSPTLAIKQTLLPDLRRTPELAQAPLRAFLLRVTEVLGPSSVLFILLDQFEEFFTRVPDEETRNHFIEDLGDCVEDQTLRTRFVLSLRKDNFADLSDFRDRIPYIFANEYSLKLLTRTEAASAISEPAALVGLTYEQGLDDEILDELQGDDQKAVMPAQLQLVCWALYRGLGGERQVITRTALEQMDGVAGILRNYLQRVIGIEIPAAQREQAQRVLESLVRSDRTRDIKTEAEIARDAGPAQTLPRVLSDLVNSRLLRVVEATPDEETAYELAHDYLIQQIELDPEVLARKAAQELLDQEVAAWERNPKLLIGEEKLQVIKAQESKIHFSPEAKELYEKSKRARRRRRGILFSLFSLALLISCVAFFLYWSWTVAKENLGIAENALVTATSVIQSAEEKADEAERRQATAEIAAHIAQTAQSEAVAAEATASIARQTAEAGKRFAEEAEQTAVAGRYVAQTRQAQAEQSAATAVSSEATAAAAQQQAIYAQQTAQAGRATAQAGEQAAVYAQQTAQAQQELAEEAARQAQAAAEAAQQAQAEAEEAARQAQEDKARAEQAAQDAEATRVAVEALRDQAERELQETQRVAAIIRHTENCNVGDHPGALAFDGANIWVTNKADDTVTKLRSSDCANLGTFSTGSAPSDVVYGDGHIWVADRLDNMVRKIRTSDGVTLDTFPAGPPPDSEPTTLLYDGTAIWVASATTNKIRKIDPDTGAELDTYDTGHDPSDLTYDGSNVWIANYQSDTVSRIEASTGASTGVFPVGARPVWIIYDGSNIWVANRVDNTITKLQASNGALLATFNTGSFPNALAFDGANIWSANMGDNNITRIQPTDGAQLSEISTARTPMAMIFDGANIWVVCEDDDVVQKIPVTIHLVGKEPSALAYDGSYIWVANKADHTISKLLASTGERLESFGVGNEPVALISAGGNIWVANSGDDTVSKLRIADGTHLGTFPVGDTPSALAYDGTCIWVTNEDSGSVTRLRESDGENTGTFPVGSGPVDILYDGSNVWVANLVGQSLIMLNPDGSQATTYHLGIAPQAFLYDGTYFWVGYTDALLETKLRQIRASDGAVISDTSTGSHGPPAVAYDGTFIWISSRADDIVTRVQALSPANLTAFPVGDKPSALVYTGSGVWVACQDDAWIQKLPGDTGLSGLLTLERSALQIVFSKDAFSFYLPVILKQYPGK